MLEAVPSAAYTTLLFDLDHTLLDSDASEALAFAAAMRSVGVGDGAIHFAAYDRINRALWAAVERQEVAPGHVRVARFEQFVDAVGLDVDPAALAETFVAGLAAYGELYAGAREVLDRLAATSSLTLITNGLSDVQRNRIERLDIARYFDAVVISAEVGATKPSTAIFDVAFDLLGRPSKLGALMIGDSLSSDIAGGTNYGIATCWYNPHGRAAGATDHVDHIVDALDQLPDVVAGIH